QSDAPEAPAPASAPDPKTTKGPQWPTTSPWYTTPGSPEAGKPIPTGDNLGWRGAAERLEEPLRRTGAGLVQLAGVFGGTPEQQASFTKQEDARRAAYEARQGAGSGTQADIASALIPSAGAAGT